MSNSSIPRPTVSRIAITSGNLRSRSTLSGYVDVDTNRLAPVSSFHGDGDNSDNGEGKFSSRVCCMLSVPPTEVPSGVLSLVSPYIPFVQHVQIFATSENYGGGYAFEGTYLILFHMADASAAQSMSRNYDGVPYSTLVPDERCILRIVRAANFAGEEVPICTPSVATLMPSTATASMLTASSWRPPVAAAPSSLTSSDCDGETRSRMELRALAAATFAVTASLLCDRPSGHDGEGSLTSAEERCAVCLEPLDRTFGSLSTLPLSCRKYNCTSVPVASSAILTTVCNHSFHLHCAVRCGDAPCPVCRFDHGTDLVDAASSACDDCGEVRDVWVCLICGHVGCSSGGNGVGPGNEGHAAKHYEMTLHAYVSSAVSQHVWDFAGGGFVHRLVNTVAGEQQQEQQKNDMGNIGEMGLKGLKIDDREGQSVEDPQNLPLGKIVEVPDMNNPTPSLERSSEVRQRAYYDPSSPPSPGGDEAVHQKLEGWADHYNNILKEQMRQQRLFYEERMEVVQREYRLGLRQGGRGRGRGKIDATSAQELIVALKQEKNMLEQRVTTLTEKCRITNRELTALKDMNEGLETNRLPLEQALRDREKELLIIKRKNEAQIQPLEQRVQELMLRLGGDTNNSG
uniref:UBP-type domain-containing protein n=1 Tax=Corethron hystrix TaxID=216773 RepID=A0A7S1B5S1_9STRA|mmetsp:Transcript_1255/g.2545  ORF Transcript_1255/g.2545 Transcript_1255/m.2545 type:complete len:628 (+) Transcript_1255:190-2073(+)|eukprot:CAMPEP_0113316020 /NCGR_PEP_ID=MMETSP0010_2-20120614/11450_1 /TAXON_ID=216773 ORGANISM="Corethron hystrix, Strain 308" /NCGR_SAMPLE_ID=MMETSP0010_2 /ASSEMBLY_ACC=CAM_ASM_000155 /LENGTH=627 /DNA_ID=CAMNT_0000172627 /DNA_START=87 /DNA_END=1970 /DNA_ORIENTATION=- /assembly_acc=CAM_ASM_000155